MKYTDKRLPKGITIWRNAFEEFVAVEGNRVAQFDGKNVAMGLTKNIAVEHYLNKRLSNGTTA